MGKIYTHQGGRADRQDEVYVRRHKSHDISVRRKEGYQYTRSREQRQARVSFGERVRRAAEWRRANEHPPTAEYKRLLRRYKNICKKTPDRYMSFWQFLIANCNKV